MKFISIDSSLAHTGIAIGTIGPTNVITVEEIALNSTEKSKNKQVRASSDTIERCQRTFQFVQACIFTHSPDVIFVETPSGSQSAAGMKSYGATCQLIATLVPDPIQVTPNEVKMASVGSKTASKVQMIEWAYAKYPKLEWYWHAKQLQAKNEHMADAVAIAHAGIKTADFIRIQHLIK